MAVGAGVLILANHATELDWLSLHAHSGAIESLKVVVGPHFERVPLLGPLLAFWDFPVARKGQPLLTAQQLVEAKGMAYSGGGFSLLVFPEGDFVKATTREKSAAFAKAQDVPDYRHLILPRTTGLAQLLPSIRLFMEDAALLDLTLLYPQASPSSSSPPTEYPHERFSIHRTLVQGKGPREVTVHVRDVWMGEVLDFSRETDDGVRRHFDEWLRRKWAQKYERLERFYRNGGRLLPEEGEAEQVLHLRPRFSDLACLSALCSVPLLPLAVLYAAL
ncbi:hypothetical protein JCM6882_006998 [Rhodosporidiobolus microsporus]